MNELEWVARIRALAGKTPGMVLGIGDDCAIYRPRAGEDLVFTTDLLIEDVHFTRATHRPFDIGYKALARGLSDIAAMGAQPRFCLLSLAVPNEPKLIAGFYQGLLAHGVPLAGGDLAQRERLFADIIVAGSVPRGKALRRDGARAGDDIYVSGPLGGSALGLATRKGKAWKKHVHPETRVALGQQLRGRATACMDLSDGLSVDLHRLCVASGIAAELDRVPLFKGASEEQALHGGEDYELLFTARKPVRGCFRIGRIVKGKPGEVMWRGRPLRSAGYDHFR